MAACVPAGARMGGDRTGAGSGRRKPAGRSASVGRDGGVAKAAADPFGCGFPWATFDTTTQGAGLAVTAREYDQLTHTTGSADYGSRWLGNILGRQRLGCLAHRW
jgi:hypothetical protein